MLGMGTAQIRDAGKTTKRANEIAPAVLPTPRLIQGRSRRMSGGRRLTVRCTVIWTECSKLGGAFCFVGSDASSLRHPRCGVRFPGVVLASVYVE